ncbi:hypothetical protein OOZ19_03140 [Saccharopolyspora sp. NFXS83]|uniref:hypothetical protein n=1 Tax=Saccharopolyspora sp. NFXS83 TaxID=2993560 RepID=UPI00224A7BBD|nr:hypothetical protein [Saccharopolyspora sp. NFXS83]MCX2729222.1 hypothetical protein [Saccharopolyspora sp. NFXS83]
MSLGYIAHQAQQAVTHYERSLEFFRELGDTSSEADLLEHLGRNLVELDQPRARGAWERALDLYEAQHRRIDAERLRDELDGLPHASDVAPSGR